MRAVNAATVSVVLVNFRGADDTIAAVAQLERLDAGTRTLEIIVVENGSGGNDAERIRREAPAARLVLSEENLGFAGGCNLGVRESTGAIVAFLNNDARPDERWLTAALAVFDDTPRAGAVASQVRDWDGGRVDYAGAALSWFGMGYKPHEGERIAVQSTERERVLFGTGSAVLVRRDVFDALGGFDERYFMFFEDVDLGWRINLAGHDVIYEPASIVFHKHHASMSGFGSHKETYLLERNALFTLYKNLGDDALARALPAALALGVRRAVARAQMDSEAFDLRRGASDSDTTTALPNPALATVFGIDQFVEQLDTLHADRQAIQASRVVTDAAIWPLFGEQDAPAFGGKHYRKGYEGIVNSFGVLDAPSRTRVLVITGDSIGVKMAGPAIRAWHMANALSADNEVVLASMGPVEQIPSPFRIVHVPVSDEAAMAPLEAEADVIVFQGLAMASFRTIRESRKIIVADIYDPMHLEQLEQARELGEETWNFQVSSATGVINQQLQRADYFVCASERQRFFYLGQMAALGRINVTNYKDDPDLRGLIDVVPFGLEDEPPVHTTDVLKGVVPGIAADDKVLLWSGGLYNWFDPQTLIRAVAELAQTRPEVKLFFQGTKHPNPGVPEMSIVQACRRLATDLGVFGTNVFFNESWVDYRERQNYLLEADAGVSTHHSHIETTFSFRTRILDYLWSGLPMVVTEGDHFGDLVRAEGLGEAVPAGDVPALTAALERMLFDEEHIAASRANIARVREEYRWSEVLRPLVGFVAEHRHARDRPSGAAAEHPAAAAASRLQRPGPLRNVRLALFHLRNSGPRVVLSKIKHRLRG